MTNKFIQWERSNHRYSMKLCNSFTPGETALLGSWPTNIKDSETDRHHIVALSQDDLRQLILTAVKLLGRGPAEQCPAFKRTDVRCYPE